MEERHKLKTLLVFDFDGVLRDAASNRQARPYANIENDLCKLAATGDYIMAIASFNPRALTYLERWDLLQYFTCFRAGANHPWKDERAYDAAHPPPTQLTLNASSVASFSGFLSSSLGGSLNGSMDEIYWGDEKFCRRWGQRASKSEQIKSMLANELASQTFHTIVFFDDCASNIADVNRVFSRRHARWRRQRRDNSDPTPPPPQVECVYVQPRFGFQTNLLPVSALYL